MKRFLFPNLLFFILSLNFHFPGTAQTKRTNIAYGPFTAIGTSMSVQGNNLYFIGRYAADTQEWMKLDLGNSNTSTNTTLVTNDHYRTTSGTIVRYTTRIGSNIFSSYAKPTTVMDLEFSRFNTVTGTEQWVDINPGTAGFSDPNFFSLDAASNRVYFNASTAAGNQIWYWNPANSSVTQLTSISGGIQQSTNGNIAILGNYIYTAATINSYVGFIRIDKNSGSYVFYNANNISSPRFFTVANNKLFFTGRTGSTISDPFNVYVYTPTNEGFTKLTNYTQTIAEGNVTSFALTPDKTNLFVNVFYYNTTPTQGNFLSVNTITNVVTDRSGPTLTDRNVYLHSSNNFVYVSRISGTTRSIYKINLANNASTLLTGTQYTVIGTPTDGFNGSIYLSATEPTYGSEVYSLNLSTDAFTRLTDINTSGNSGPFSFTPSGSNLYFVASATGTAAASSDYEIYSLPIAMVLPLKWISFSAIPNSSGDVQLNWKVAEQQQVKKFIVEMSSDASKWEPVTAVLASNTNNSYQYTYQASSAKAVYYRIKEESMDGTFSYSDIRKVVITAHNAVSLASNPSQDKTITVLFTTATASSILTVTDDAGHMVDRRAWSGGAGKVQIKVANAGVYSVHVDGQPLRAVVQ